MKKTFHIELPDDFRTACEIFGFRPETVIQEFARRVSLPRYFGNRESKHRWANLFFLDYMDNLAPPLQQPGEIHDKYIALLDQRIDAAKNDKKREAACRDVLQLWAAAVKEKSPRKKQK